MSSQIVWINTSKYTVTELVVFGLGCLMWAIAYGGVIRGLIKRKFVEIPAIAVMANIAWEFNWAWVYQSRFDMGRLFLLGYQIWFFLDVFINYGLYRYGHKQVKNELLQRYFRPAYIVGLIAWVISMFFYVGDGYDTPTGATSAFILAVVMGVAYIPLFAEKDTSNFSYLVAWTSLIGNALFGVFVFLALDKMYFLYTMVVATLVSNAAYLVLFHYRLKQASLAGLKREEPSPLPSHALLDLP